MFRFRLPDGSLNMENPTLVPLMISIAMLIIIGTGEILHLVF